MMTVTGVQCIMMAVLKQRHPGLLFQNGGPLKLCYNFCKGFVKRELNWTIRKATTAAQKVPANWKTEVLNMTKRLAIHVYQGRIPRELLFSMDETFSYFVPMGHASTLDVRGAKVRCFVHIVWQNKLTCIFMTCRRSTLSGLTTNGAALSQSPQQVMARCYQCK